MKRSRAAIPWMSLLAMAGIAPLCRAQDSLSVKELLLENRASRERAQWIEDNVILKALKPYTDLKQWSRTNLKLDFGFQYSVMYQRATGSRDPQDVAVGDLDFFGQWRLVDTPDFGKGELGFLVEYRHNITDNNVREFSDAVGTEYATNNWNIAGSDRFAVRQLWWEHRFADDALIVTFGKLRARSYYNGNRFANSTGTQFFSQPFSANRTVRFPQDGLGLNARVTLSELIYVTAGFQDANSSVTKTGFDTFGDGDFFSAVEVGLTPEFEGLGRGIYRFTLWHTDASVRSGEGAGFTVSFDQDMGESLGLFLRYGYGDPDAARIEHLLAGGLVVRNPFAMTGDLFGVGLSWDRPDSAAGSEYAFETFYRFQLTTHLQITPSFLLAINPVNSDSDLVGVFGIRARVLF
jgi:carbohydrate-selective porin OprB